MANPNFVPEYSTNQIYVDADYTVCLTDTLDEMNTDIGGKAASTHTHDNYAPIAHTHADYASVSHTHTEYAETTHTHTEYASTTHTHSDYASSTHTHDGYASTDHTHSGFASDNHNHDTEYIKKALQFVSDNGDVKENISGTNVLTTIGAKTAGVYTFYSDTTSTNIPRAHSSWRYLAHKTNVNYGWVMAFASEGSVFTNYLHNGSWTGWQAVVDMTPVALWTGAKVMTSSETITPSKKLSECRNGWILEWSDYNADSSSSANTNFVQTVIYKKFVNGSWDGKNMMFPVPNYLSDDGATQSTAIKQLIVYDDKLVGHIANDKNTANLDVALRAVYEF